MVWRRLLVRRTCTLRELHGVIQVAMGWGGIHLYQFCLRSGRYGSSELSASSPEVTVAALRLRKGARSTYEYDLTIPWRHEIRIENWLAPKMGKAHPVCTGGGGACPPEDCDGPAGFMARRNAMLSMDGLEDLDTMAEIIGGDRKPKRRLFKVLKNQGLRANQDVTFLTDGGEEVRALTELVTPEAEHVLDWFHITMRLTVLSQYARGVAHHDEAEGARLLVSVDSIKWLLWHGNQHRAGEEIAFFEDVDGLEVS